MSPEKAYDDLAPEDLADEIYGLDSEIESYQKSIGNLRRLIKQKEGLRDSLVEIWSRHKQIKGWQVR